MVNFHIEYAFLSTDSAGIYRRCKNMVIKIYTKNEKILEYA